MLLHVVQVESVFSSSARGRSQSMRGLIRRPQTNSYEQSARSSTSSSSASASTSTQVQNREAKPSTSAVAKKTVRIEEKGLENVDLQYEHEFMRNALQEATAGTNSPQLNPARDGVYARLRKNLFRNGASFVVGLAAGVGFNFGSNLTQIFKSDNFESTTAHTNNTSNNDDEIINKL